MSDIDTLFDALNIEENPVKVNFEVDGYKFWLNKGKGIIRKKIPAGNFLRSFATDEIGVMEGKYDGVIEHLVNGLVHNTDNGKPVSITSKNYWDWIGELPEVDVEGRQVQMEMMISLPQAVAAIILGKSQLKSMTPQNLTSSQSSLPQEKQSSTIQQKPTVSKSTSKKHARKLPKTAK